MTTRATEWVYIIQDELIKHPLGIYLEPDVAIDDAKQMINDDYGGRTHLLFDMEASIIAVYKVPLNCFIRTKRPYEDCIWESLDMKDDDSSEE